MRPAGSTTRIDSEKYLFISQAADNKQIIDERKRNKAFDFLLTKDNVPRMLAIRAYEAQPFAASEEFLEIPYRDRSIPIHIYSRLDAVNKMKPAPR